MHFPENTFTMSRHPRSRLTAQQGVRPSCGRPVTCVSGSNTAATAAHRGWRPPCRDRRKQEKYLARNAAKLEAEAKAAEEAAAAAAAEAAAATAAGEAKKLRQVERKAMQKERSRLRNICGTPRECRVPPCCRAAP